MYDYIIVGAGSAGCVLANRLSADGSKKVLLLEAGPPDRNIWIKIPAGLSRVFVHPRLNWGFFTGAEPGLDGRKIYWPRGKTLGGTSAINGMAYMRGQPQDYDHWRDLGNPGWGYADVLPLFRKGERWQRGANAFHGGDGELGVSDPAVRHRASAAFIEAGRQLGLQPTEDFNGERQEGVGWLQFTILDGRRHSTATAFLDPVKRRPNLSVRTGVHVQRVLLEGRQARGVVLRTQGGGVEEVRGNETILAAGAIGSPQLLMLSGIGPGAHLQECGVPVVHDLSGVGGNLQDHLYIHYRVRTRPDYSINSQIRFPRVVPHVLQYLLMRRGLLTLAVSQACAFVRSASGIERPDLQINFRPFSLVYTAQSTFGTEPFPSVTASCCHLRPYSRGSIRLQPADPQAAPRIFANYLAHEEDRKAMIAGVRTMRRLLAAPAFAAHAVGEVAPGAQCASDEEIHAFIREQAQSMYHPVGTCMMGTGSDAVVDPRLRVHGIGKLRVADASIMPTISSGNTNAPTIMIGEKAAELLRS